MKQPSAPKEAGRPQQRGWLQTERKTHEAWARFSLKKPTASALLHYMCAFMGPQNALVVSQTVLAKRLGVSDRTIRSAVADLAADSWIQVVRLGKGKECAYVVNDRVAWGEKRENLRLSLFSATVIADAEDQEALDGPELRRLPALYPWEQQLPTGPGEDPPSQPSMPGMEADLPSTNASQDPNPFAGMTPEQIATERGRILQMGMAELERRGQQRLPDVDKD